MWWRIQNGYRKLCTTVMWAASVLIVLQLAYGFGNVFGRALFNHALLGVTDFTKQSMVHIVFLGLAYVQIRDGHIRVDFLFRLVGKRAKAALDVFALAAGLLFCALLIWANSESALHSLKIGEVSRDVLALPVYPQRFAVIVGSFLLAGQLLIDLVDPLRNLIKVGSPK